MIGQLWCVVCVCMFDEVCTFQIALCEVAFLWINASCKVLLFLLCHEPFILIICECTQKTHLITEKKTQIFNFRADSTFSENMEQKWKRSKFDVTRDNQAHVRMPILPQTHSRASPLHLKHTHLPPHTYTCTLACTRTLSRAHAHAHTDDLQSKPRS